MQYSGAAEPIPERSGFFDQVSYYRDCRKCGRRIQLREMPGRQWVAFEGYDTIHNCSKPAASNHSEVTHAPALNSEARKSSSYDNLDFADIDIATDGLPTPQRQESTPAKESRGDAIRRARSERREGPRRDNVPFTVSRQTTPSSPTPASTRTPRHFHIPAWAWWVGVAAVAVALRACS
jgi:hypothetical protein